MGGHVVHASRVAVAKADGSNEGVHRLEDIEVKEVSLVDRPANKRPFLVVKRSDQMSTQVQPDGKGGFTAAGDASKAGPPPMPPGAGVPPGGEKKKPKAIGKLDVPPGFKEMMGPMLAKASEKLKELADAVGSSTAVEVGDDGEMPGVPAEFSDALGAIMGTLDKLAGMWPSAPSGGGAEMEGEGDEPPMPTEMQMRAALDNIGKTLGHPKVEKAIVTKIGAKMAKERFSRLQQAAQTLTSLINELAPSAATPAAPAGGLGKSEEGKALLKSIEDMLTPVIAGLNQVGVVVKQQKSELETIKKSRGTGNAAPDVEGSGKAPASDGFSWPLDLNNPVNKETVSKTESFFGDD
jgi:hypothetical protein